MSRYYKLGKWYNEKGNRVKTPVNEFIIDGETKLKDKMTEKDREKFGEEFGARIDAHNDIIDAEETAMNQQTLETIVKNFLKRFPKKK